MNLRNRIALLSIAALVVAVAGCSGLSPAGEVGLAPPADTPENLRILLVSAEGALAGKEYESALRLYGDILAQGAVGTVNSWAHLRRGWIYLAQENFSKAAHELKGVQRRGEDNGVYNEAQYLLARSYAGMKMFGAAESIVRKLEKDVKEPGRAAELEMLMGDSLAGQERYLGAVASYMNIVEGGAAKDFRMRAKEKAERLIARSFSVEQLEKLREIYENRDPYPSILCALVSSYEKKKNDTKAAYYHGVLRDRHPGFACADSRDAPRAADERYEAAGGRAIGCILPLTGRFASYGNRALDAVLFASGVFSQDKGAAVEVIVEDSGDDPLTARKAVEKLAGEERVIGIIGPMGGAASLEAAKKAQEMGIPIITLTHREDITRAGEYVFRNFLTASMQIEALVRFSLRNLGITTFAVMYPRDPMGEEMAALFRQEVAARGGQMRSAVSYAPGQTDFGAEIKMLGGLQPPGGKVHESVKPRIDFDALFIPDSYERILMIAPQLAFYDVTGVRLLGTNGWNSLELLAQEPNYVEGAVFTDAFFVESPDAEVVRFVEKYTIACHREPGDVEALAYDSAAMMVTIMREGNVRTRSAMQNALAGLAGFRGVTGETSFPGTGEARKTPYILTVQDGRIVQLYPE
jgi:branched-chain amino acid transport system substrate-binding protein